MAFEDMSEGRAREHILKLVEEYARRYKVPRKDYEEGDYIPYASRVFGAEEIVNLVDSSLEFWLTAGKWTERFEKEFAAYLGLRYCSVVNSGSSANLLAFWALTQPELGESAIRRGDEVITVAAGFPTTIAPIVQYGAVPVFVDVTMPQYNIDVSMLEKAYNPGRTKAVMIAHTLGNPFDLAAVKSFCDAHELWLVEDNCDALGSVYNLDGQECLTGTVGDIGTSSFYPPHHMTMGEGGAVYTNNSTIHRIVRSLRDWGRDCVCAPGQDNLCGHRFDGRRGDLPIGYDHKYVYSRLGFNLKATDMQAAVGCAQLERFPSFVESRKRNWAYLREALEPLNGRLLMPEPAPRSDPSWFGFMVTCCEGVERAKVVPALEKAGVQTRMLFSGNVIRHPAFDCLRGTEAYRIVGDLSNTDRIMRDTFWVGVYPGMDEPRLARMAEAITHAVED